MISKAKKQVEARPVAAKLVKPMDVAKMLGVSEWAVRKMFRDGALPFVRVGRLLMVAVTDVDDYIAEHRAVSWVRGVWRHR